MAVISGEPGIGKTRLADELYQSCVRQGHAAARSRCYAGQGQVAYAPVAEWLRSDAIRAGWTSLRPQQLAELARLVPEIREQFPELELLRSGQTSPLAESWQRLHFYESLSAAFGKEPQADSAVPRRHAVVRSRFLRVAECSVDLTRRGRRARARDSAGGRDGPRTSVHPVSGGAAAIGHGSGDSA